MVTLKKSDEKTVYAFVSGKRLPQLPTAGGAWLPQVVQQNVCFLLFLKTLPVNNRFECSNRATADFF